MLKSDLEVWRGRASAAESKPPEIHNLPDFLAEICQNATLQRAEQHARHSSDSALSIAFVFYATSAKAYRFAKAFFALPSISLIYQRMGATIHFHEENILQLEMIPRAVARWRAQWEIDPNLIVHAILAGDAAVFMPEVVANYAYHRPSNNVHLFMVLPLNPTFQGFVVHILPHPTGSLGQAGQDCHQKIAASLSESGHKSSPSQAMVIEDTVPIRWPCSRITRPCSGGEMTSSHVVRPFSSATRLASPFGGLRIVCTH
jgi:hypothetical protein